MQRDFHVRNTVQFRKHGIEPVCNVGKQRRMLFIAERHERKIQQFVRTVSDQYFGSFHAVMLGNGGREQLTLGVGI